MPLLQQDMRILECECALFINTDAHSLMQETALVEALGRDGQAHLFAGWPAAGEGDADKRRLLAQLRHLDANYAGGLCKYIQNARKLLHDSKEGGLPGSGRPRATHRAGLPWTCGLPPVANRAPPPPRSSPPVPLQA